MINRDYLDAMLKMFDRLDWLIDKINWARVTGDREMKTIWERKYDLAEKVLLRILKRING